MQETQDPQNTHSDREVGLGKSSSGASNFGIQTNIAGNGRSSSENNDYNGEEGSDLKANSTSQTAEGRDGMRIQ
jgi:hypothetical protein